jgi:hypothetical protein
MVVDRRLLLLTVAVIAVVGVVNATVYAYRWITGTINITGPDQATGAACTGFYSSSAQSGIDLPPAGTNYNAPTYGGNEISITPGNIVCQWTVGQNTYYLYESIEVTIPVTVGSWYIQDFYGFGYYRGTGSIYVYFRVDQAASSPLTTAYLIIRDSGGNEIGRIDLMTTGSMTSAITMSPGSGLRLDLYFDAGGTGTVTFKVGVYVTQESGEAPNIVESP